LMPAPRCRVWTVCRVLPSASCAYVGSRVA
jgi:hypothetical protein